MSNKNNDVTFSSIELQKYHVRIVAEEGSSAFKDFSIENLETKLTTLQISYNRVNHTCKVAALGDESADRGGTTQISLLVALRPCAKNGILS